MNLTFIQFSEESSDTIRKYCELKHTTPEELVLQWIKTLEKELPDERWKAIEGW